MCPRIVLLVALSTLLAASIQAGPRAPRMGSRLPSVLQEARMRNAPVGVDAPRGGWVVYALAAAALAAGPVLRRLSLDALRNRGSLE